MHKMHSLTMYYPILMVRPDIKNDNLKLLNSSINGDFQVLLKTNFDSL